MSFFSKNFFQYFWHLWSLIYVFNKTVHFHTLRHQSSIFKGYVVGKVSSEVGKFRCNRKVLAEVGTSKLYKSLFNFSGSFKLQPELSNSRPYFPTSFFPLSCRTFHFHVELSNLKLSNFSFCPTALSNYTYPTFVKKWKNSKWEKNLKFFFDRQRRSILVDTGPGSL